MTACPSDAAARPSAKALRYDGIAIGDPISITELPLTLQRLVIEAGVNRDYTPTHHDPALAIASGAPAPYANTPMIMALLEAGIRNWMGIEGRLLELEFKMLRFNLAGSVIRVGGEVITKGAINAEFKLDPEDWGEVGVACWMDSDANRSVEGIARLAIRRRPFPR